MKLLKLLVLFTLTLLVIGERLIIKITPGLDNKEYQDYQWYEDYQEYKNYVANQKYLQEYQKYLKIACDVDSEEKVKEIEKFEVQVSDNKKDMYVRCLGSITASQLHLYKNCVTLQIGKDTNENAIIAYIHDKTQVQEHNDLVYDETVSDLKQEGGIEFRCISEESRKKYENLKVVIDMLKLGIESKAENFNKEVKAEILELEQGIIVQQRLITVLPKNEKGNQNNQSGWETHYESIEKNIQSAILKKEKILKSQLLKKIEYNGIYLEAKTGIISNYKAYDYYHNENENLIKLTGKLISNARDVNPGPIDINNGYPDDEETIKDTRENRDDGYSRHSTSSELRATNNAKTKATGPNSRTSTQGNGTDNPISKYRNESQDNKAT
jgi:hypothetical protein